MLNDTLYVVDRGQGKRLQVFTTDGTYQQLRRIGIRTDPYSIAAMNGRLIVGGSASISHPREQGVHLVDVYEGSELRGSGCRVDPRYPASSRSGGMIWALDWSGVSALGERIFCIQNISPVIQVMDNSGTPIENIRIAPPFYLPPADQQLVQNQQFIFDYLASTTLHEMFVPFEEGFVSVYSTFDRHHGELRYSLFVCRTFGTVRCGMVQGLRRPVYIESMDTLYIEEEPSEEGPQVLGIYRLSSTT